MARLDGLYGKPNTKALFSYEMENMMTTKMAVDPLTERLQRRRSALTDRIAAVEQEIAEAEGDAARRIVRARGNSHIEANAVEGVVVAKAKLDSLRAALQIVEADIATAPSRVANYQATLPPLKMALEAPGSTR